MQYWCSRKYFILKAYGQPYNCFWYQWVYVILNYKLLLERISPVRLFSYPLSCLLDRTVKICIYFTNICCTLHEHIKTYSIWYMHCHLHVYFICHYIVSKIEKVPRGIRGEESSKDMASSRNLVSTIVDTTRQLSAWPSGLRRQEVIGLSFATDLYFYLEFFGYFSFSQLAEAHTNTLWWYV